MDVGKWLTEQKAALEAVNMIKRVAEIGPRVTFFDPPSHLGTFGSYAGNHINCRCTIKPINRLTD